MATLVLPVLGVFAALRVRVVAGEPKAGLAGSLGISRQTLYQYLRPPEPTPYLAGQDSALPKSTQAVCPDSG